MAVLTSVTLPEAARILTASGLPQARAIEVVPKGSVNSNYRVDHAGGALFLRVYEEQGPAGVAREWRLLDALASARIPAPRRLGRGAPGEVTVAGKPVGLFELLAGDELCQARVTAQHARTVGRALADAHLALLPLAGGGQGRFTAAHLRARLQIVRGSGRADLCADVARLERALDDLDAGDARANVALPSGVIHGDLFRDNVRWDGDRLLAILDWESASDGAFAYDLMVTVLAWSFGEAFDVEVARALVQGYSERRPLVAAERAQIHAEARRAAVRFAVSRLTDYELRRGLVEMQYRDYRRFLLRLDVLEGMSSVDWLSTVCA